MKPKTYRKKPVIVEAVRLTAENVYDVAAWCGGRAVEETSPRDHSDVYTGLDIPTLEGRMRANEGDYIIRGVKGEFYPIKEAIFREAYEPVEDDS